MTAQPSFSTLKQNGVINTSCESVAFWAHTCTHRLPRSSAWQCVVMQSGVCLSSWQTRPDSLVRVPQTQGETLQTTKTERLTAPRIISAGLGMCTWCCVTLPGKQSLLLRWLRLPPAHTEPHKDGCLRCSCTSGFKVAACEVFKMAFPQSSQHFVKWWTGNGMALLLRKYRRRRSFQSNAPEVVLTKICGQERWFMLCDKGQAVLAGTRPTCSLEP